MCNINICNKIYISGSIIRCMRRLEEVLRQLCQAAKGIGDTDLVFAASLYL